MGTATIIILLSGLVALSTSITAGLLFHAKKKLSRKLQSKEIEFDRLQKEFSSLVERHQQLKEFRNSMHEAEMTTKLQIPRISQLPPHHPSPSGHHGSEKYRLIHTLASKGMDNAEIASILEVSSQEVKQVLTLSAIAQID